MALSAPGNGGTNPGDDAGAAAAASHFTRSPLPIQAKLEVGAVDDPLEREADRVAEQVMRMPENLARESSGPSRSLQTETPKRQCSANPLLP